MAKKINASSKPELLSPAGDWISLRSAVESKADAVYFGLKTLNMRSGGAKNFELSELQKITKFCHDNNVKAYLTLNTIVYDKEIPTLKKILQAVKKAKVDAVIAWDFAVIKECNNLNLEVHLSTQASVSNFESLLEYYTKFKIKRFVLARELSLDDISNIIAQIKKNKLPIEIEVFAHGAMCVSMSGRCFISQFQFNKSANRGECLQPCRRQYKITDIEETEKELTVGNNYVLSPKDLCTISFIDKLIKAGIHTFKIEGRNRSPEYVKVVTAVYREAIDKSLNNSFKKEDIQYYLTQLNTVYNRGFSTGFFLGKPINEWTDDYGSKAVYQKVYVGLIKNFFAKIGVAEVFLESQDLRVGDKILIQGNKTGTVDDVVISIQKSGKSVDKALKRDRVGIKINHVVRQNDKLFKVVKVKESVPNVD